MGSVDAASTARPLHVVFFPLMSPGHMIPMVDMARLFALRGVRSSVVTTPGNAPSVRPAIDAAAALGHPLALHLIPFPDPSATGLAPACENLADVPAAQFEKFVNALFLFQAPVTALLRDLRPDALVSDSLFTWTADLAADLGVPRLIFHGAGAFPQYVICNLLGHFPFQESFTMDGLPHPIRLYKDGLPELMDNFAFLQLLGEAEGKSYGVVVNTYREMEPTYVDYYKKHHPQGLRAWCVGPVSLCCRAAEEERAKRGGLPATEANRILSWLDGKPAGSVVYLCFGSLCRFGVAQLRAIAKGLEASGRAFLWVVRREAEGVPVAEEKWMPEGFEERVRGRGLLVRGWAPQLAVLGHPAVGWFVTHCGWNSLQEAVCAGVPMLTWPLFHEQFINQELVVEVMGAGLRVWEGLRRCRLPEQTRELVSAEEVEAAVRKATGGGEDAEAVRRRAKEYGEAARKAVEEGGSTHEDVTNLIKELEAVRLQKAGQGEATQ
ncbi:hypothetical protein GW17_00013301 [Ensete ventricosum]|nr:hypothetical protein GW17_00013301 [Ensete ventricosum]RZR95525.1 hypothetical protein BHM03_00024384 [Ensete ventricosum]